MKKMKKLSLIILLLIMVAAAIPAFAAEPPVFNAMYWLKGTTIPGINDPGHSASTLIQHRKVVFYRTLPGSYILAPIEFDSSGTGNPQKSGKFIFNIYDNGKLVIDPQYDYYAAVPRVPESQGGDNYGAAEVKVNITGNGFETVQLKIEYGKGPVLPLPGAIQLFISRDVNKKDIKLSWDNDAYPDKPVIWALSDGNGSGSYVNTTATNKWSVFTTKLTTNSEGFFLHAAQVGDGLPEIYYKATEKGLDDLTKTKGANTVAQILESAWAVGKMNISLQKGTSLVSLPFNYPNSIIGEALGPASPVWQNGDLAFLKTSAGPNYKGAIYNNGQWVSQTTGLSADINFDPRYGNLIYVGANKVFTAIGGVNASEQLNQPIAVTIWGGGGTHVGALFPRMIGLSQTSVITDGGADGDGLYMKTSAAAPDYAYAVLYNNSGNLEWRSGVDPVNSPPPAVIGTLKPPYGYLYTRSGSQFIWQRWQ
ncbi:MAG: hypothetical protein KKC80_00970 [Candidatus Margulisbacteria bacterium]|nr:hypothetical protein [Candidatus Margulisiibacteriota bacterium]MBU1616447.1 hypothetical protein [Candidatus Margulisiibacteriota bacterium]